MHRALPLRITDATADIIGVTAVIAIRRRANNPRNMLENEEGEPGGSPLTNLLRRKRSALSARMFRERLAPRERCVQLCFSFASALSPVESCPLRSSMSSHHTCTPSHPGLQAKSK